MAITVQEQFAGTLLPRAIAVIERGEAAYRASTSMLYRVRPTRESSSQGNLGSSCRTMT